MKTLLSVLLFAGLLLPPLRAAPLNPVPRLAGIARLPGRRVAILEIVTARSGVTRQLVLNEGQREGGTKVLQIDPETGVVKLELAGTNVTASLVFTQQANHAGNAVSSVILDRARLDPVLKIYSELKARTLLRSPWLPAAALSLNLSTTNAAQTALMLEQAFAEKGIKTIPDGEKFLLVVPESEATRVKPHPSGIKSITVAGDQADMIPPGAINFAPASLRQAGQIYAELVGRKLESNPQTTIPDRLIIFQNQTSLSKAECVYALDILFRWQGVQAVPLEQGWIRLTPISEPIRGPDN